MSKHQPIISAQPCSDSLRAQLVINQHLARIEVAERFLAANKSRLLPSIHATLATDLTAARSLCDWYFTEAMSIPKHICGMLGGNGFGPKIDAACEAVGRAVTRSTETRAHRNEMARRLAALNATRETVTDTTEKLARFLGRRSQEF